MREVIGRNRKCPLCERSFLEAQRISSATFVHDKAGRVHLMCSFKPELWTAWMQRTGQIPTPVDIEVEEK